MERGLGSSEESGRDEPMWVVIHMCMETMLGISLYSCPYLKLAKMPCFSFLCFFLLQNWRTRGQNWFCLEAGGQGGEGGSNSVYTYK
jgi:hypothetical protein